MMSNRERHGERTPLFVNGSKEPADEAGCICRNALKDILPWLLRALCGIGIMLLIYTASAIVKSIDNDCYDYGLAQSLIYHSGQCAG